MHHEQGKKGGFGCPFSFLRFDPFAFALRFIFRRPPIPAARIPGDEMNRLQALAAATLAALSFSAHAIGSLADVTILDRASGRELPVSWHQGRAYVVGKPGNEYQVVVRSRRSEDLLAVVSVDGLNVMNGETASPLQGGYVLSPWNRLDIRGWRKSLDQIAAFYFTSLGDSYAARTDRPDNVGVIGVALFPRKRYAPQLESPLSAAPEPSRKRADSTGIRGLGSDWGAPAEAQSAAPAASAPLGTGHGRREESHVQWVNFERASDAPAETIAIYYDSYRNLVARGVLQQPHSPRDPNPFPTAFAPDPWR
jgi:hypothetical protein